MLYDDYLENLGENSENQHKEELDEKFKESLEKQVEKIENEFEIIAQKVQTTNHKLFDISDELTEIENAFRDIQKEIRKYIDKLSEEERLFYPVSSSIAIFYGRNRDLFTLPYNLKGDIYVEINTLINHYNAIINHISTFKKTDQKSSELEKALAPYTYYDAVDVLDEKEAEGETGALSDFLYLTYKLSTSLQFNCQNRFQLPKMFLLATSFVLGYLSVEFYSPLSIEGASLLPFLNYEWLAVAGGVGLNFFLNSYFFSDSVRWILNEAIKIIKTNSPELCHLQNLDQSCSAKMWRGIQTAARLSFIATLSGASVVPFAAADWEEVGSYSNLAVVIIMYLSLHMPGSETVRKMLLKPFEPMHWLYRHCVYSEKNRDKYNTQLVATNVKAAFRRNFETAFNRLLDNKVTVNKDLLKRINQLILKPDKSQSEVIQLLFAINLLASAPADDYMLNNIISKLVQTAGAGGITLTLLGYAFDAAYKVSDLLHEPVTSLTNIALSLLVASAFFALYNKIIWDMGKKIYDSTLGIPVKYVCRQWKATRTWMEYFKGMTWGAFKNILNYVPSYFIRLRETIKYSHSIIDFLAQHGSTVIKLLILPEIILGIGSSASVLKLNLDYLADFSEWLFDDPKLIFMLTVYPAIITASLVNTYAVNPVLGAVYNIFTRIIVCADERKVANLLSVLRDDVLKLIDESDPAMINAILFDSTKRNPENCEKIIASFSVGQTVKDVFGKEYVDVEKPAAKNEAIEGDFIPISISDKKTPFSDAVTKLQSKLACHGFFKPQKSHVLSERDPLLPRSQRFAPGNA